MLAVASQSASTSGTLARRTLPILSNKGRGQLVVSCARWVCKCAGTPELAQLTTMSSCLLWASSLALLSSSGLHRFTVGVTDQHALSFCIWEAGCNRVAAVVVVQVEQPQCNLVCWQDLQAPQGWKMLFAPADVASCIHIALYTCDIVRQGGTLSVLQVIRCVHSKELSRAGHNAEVHSRSLCSAMYGGTHDFRQPMES